MIEREKGEGIEKREMGRKIEIKRRKRIEREIEIKIKRKRKIER